MSKNSKNDVVTILNELKEAVKTEEMNVCMHIVLLQEHLDKIRKIEKTIESIEKRML